jgi:hypothetical protein
VTKVRPKSPLGRKLERESRQPNPLTPFPVKEGGTENGFLTPSLNKEDPHLWDGRRSLARFVSEGNWREIRGNLTPNPFPCGKANNHAFFGI